MNHIRDAKKMVGDTPRTDAEANEQYSMVLTGNGLRRALVQSDFARQLERELQQWKEYAGRLEEAGNLSDDQRGCTTCDEYVCIECRKASEAWDKAKETKP